MPNKNSGLTVCLAGSGGGHVRQLLDLEEFWATHDYFFVTENSALGRSIAETHQTEFLPHFALGQAKLGQPLLMIGRAFTSMWKSLQIVARRRPDLVVTTGAGSQLFVIAWARLFGAKIILVDSFARFERPSAFARLAAPLAHMRIAQSAAAGRNWPGAIVYDPLRAAPETSVLKENLLFATVGATLPFPRLVKIVLDAKRAGLFEEEVILQVGADSGDFDPVEGVDFVESLPFDELKGVLDKARIVVCHGGTGSIITSLQAQCSTIVLPRRFERGEHYDNHQSEICQVFKTRGLVEIADDNETFAEALKVARAKGPRPVKTDYSGLAKILRNFVDNL